MFVPMTSAGVKPNSRSAAELKECDDSVLVDHDHRVGHGIENRREVGRARKSVIRAGRGLHTIALQLLSAPGHACADQDECNGVDDFGHRKAGKVRDHEEAEHGAEAGGQQARSQPAESGSDQNRGDEEQIGRIPLAGSGSAPSVQRRRWPPREEPSRTAARSCRIKSQRLTLLNRGVSLGLSAKWARNVFMSGPVGLSNSALRNIP